MRYVLLAYVDEQARAADAGPQREAHARACRDNDEQLRAAGCLLGSLLLQGSAGAANVRAGAVSAGPLAPGREQLVGIFTISARDLNDAIRVAMQMPQARSGPIEVRPLQEPDGQESPAGSERWDTQ